jgi:hypothetical protein
MGKGNAGQGGHGNGRTDSRQYPPRDAGGFQGLGFFETAAEDKGIAAFEPQDPFSGPGPLQQQGVDMLLALGLEMAAFFRGNAKAGVRSQFQYSGIHQAIVNEDFGVLQSLGYRHGEHIPVAGSAPGQQHRMWNRRGLGGIDS